MDRLVMPELLDHLAEDDPLAIGSRRDLARINWVMRQPQLMATQLRRLKARPRVIMDLGSGDGRFLLAVARKLAWPGMRAVIVDAKDGVSTKTKAEFAALDWHLECRIGDVFAVLDAMPEADATITANLFLHHFDDAALARLLALAAAHSTAFVACEPRRSHWALLGASLVGLLGANRVTRHDAIASVRAGFAGQDLSALWPMHAVTEHFTFPFTHVFVAGRDAV